MAKAEWTYQVAPAGSDSAGLEEYVVESASGAQIGKVSTLLRRRDELYVAVERGTPPLSHDVRAFPWSEVEHVDHSALAVRLKTSDEAVDQKSLELDPAKAVESGEAEATRMTELPSELQPSATPEAGPVDRPTYALAIALGMLGLLALLAIVVAAVSVDFTWHFALFAIPVALFAAAGATAYRVVRRPYERA